MARTPRPAAGPLALAAGLWAACSTPSPTPEKVTPAPAAAADPAQAAPASDAEAVTPPPLSEEDLALIAADPKDLTPEMRRKRAYARRRQIMQNPDSPTARALDDLVKAYEAGEIDVKGKGSDTWFSTPGSKPTGGRPPAGWRPSDPEGKATPAPAPAPAPPAAPVSEAADPP
jgi:hypothetical protein